MIGIAQIKIANDSEFLNKEDYVFLVLYDPSDKTYRVTKNSDDHIEDCYWVAASHLKNILKYKKRSKYVKR